MRANVEDSKRDRACAIMARLWASPARFHDICTMSRLRHAQRKAQSTSFADRQLHSDGIGVSAPIGLMLPLHENGMRDFALRKMQDPQNTQLFCLIRAGS